MIAELSKNKQGLFEMDAPNKCLSVHFANGEWFRYYKDEIWG